MIAITMIFWILVFFILHTYIFYPLVLMFLAKKKITSHHIHSSSFGSNVSVVISVYNEEKTLSQKILNLKTIQYPASQLEFLFGSDGSNDLSVKLLNESDQMSIRIFEYPQRRGKAAVLNDLISQAKGEIIVFTDANTEFESNTIQELVKHFDDPAVGAVSGNLILRANKLQVNAGEYSYWAFENKLKLMESSFSSLLGATGGVYAIRKNLFTPLPTDISVTDDFLIPMKILLKGFRTVYEPKALAYEEMESSIRKEFLRKVRIGAQNINILPLVAPLLHPKYKFISFSFWSHKILRWLVPFFLLAITLLLFILSDISQLYFILYTVTIIFWGVGLIGLIADIFKFSIGYLGYPYYFLAMNLALCTGTFKALFGLQKPSWNVVR